MAHSADPLAPDPYESRLVAVAPSLIPGASEGLFARAELEPGTTVAFYNGSRADPADFSPDTWETNNYRIFDPADCPAGTIDIPAWAQTTAGYCGSLAHKCNHSFSPNAQFVVFDHPKFGLIPAVMVTQDLEQGEEVGHDTRCPHIISHNVLSADRGVLRVRPPGVPAVVQAGLGALRGAETRGQCLVSRYLHI